MQISFSYNRPDTMRSISIVGDFIDQLQKTHSFYYFPFLEQHNIDAQIAIDEANFNPMLALSRFSELWNMLKTDVFSSLGKFSNTYSEFNNLHDYKVIVTFYGPYGYYEAPNIVYVNVSQKDPEFWIETFLHEFLHLVFLERTAKFTFEETEHFIDSVFVEIFGHVFPRYHVQKF